MKTQLQKIGLKPYEIRLIFYCLHAHTIAACGNFCVPSRMIKSAKRLVDMGYLTGADVQVFPSFNDWYFVKITQENIDAINAKIGGLQ